LDGSVQSSAGIVLDGGLRILVTQNGDTSTIAFEGEWDLANQVAAREAVGRLLARRPDCLVLDLSRLTFIDASGVHAMISLAKRTERLRIRFLIVPGPRPVQRIFEICHITDRLPFTDPREPGQGPLGPGQAPRDVSARRGAARSVDGSLCPPPGPAVGRHPGGRRAGSRSDRA
jgi:anti-anti-sigma factor